MKKLLSIFVLAFAFTTANSQTCGNLTISNYSGTDLYVEVGFGNSCIAYGNAGSYSVPNGQQVSVSSVPIYNYWMGIVAATSPFLGFPNPRPSPTYHYENTNNPFTCTGANSPGYTVTWTSGCAVQILP